MVRISPSASLYLCPPIAPLIVLVNVHVTSSPAERFMDVLKLPSLHTAFVKSHPLTVDSVTEYVPGKRLVNLLVLDNVPSVSSSNEKTESPVPDVKKLKSCELSGLEFLTIVKLPYLVLVIVQVAEPPLERTMP